MNFWTLQFTDRTVQHSYNIFNQSLMEKRIENQCWFVLFVLIILIIELALKNEWIGMSIWSFCLLLLFFSRGLKHKIQLIENYFYISMILLFTLYKPNSNFWHGINNQPIYIETFLSTVASFCLLNNLEHLTKTFLILIIFIGNAIIYYQNVKTPLVLQDLLYLGLILQHLYQKEKWKKITFMEELNRMKMTEVLYNQQNLQLFRVILNNQLRQFILLGKNLQNVLCESDQGDFTQLIREIKITMRKTGNNLSEQITPKKLNAQITLESFLFQMMNPCSGSQRLIFQNQKEHHLIGKLEEENYQISIHQSYYLQPCVLVFVKKSLKENQIEELKLKRDIIMRGLDTVQDIFFTNIKPCLIYFIWIKKFADQITDQQKVQMLYKVIEAKLFKAQNEYQNIKDFYTINQTFQKTTIQAFCIEKALEFVTETVTNSYSHKRFIKISVLNKLAKNVIKSDQSQLMQLFFNILFFVVEKSDSITINLKDYKIDQESDDVMQVKIDYTGNPMTKQYLLNLPIINPQGVLDYRHNSSGAFELELPIALMIIRKLGPQDKLIWRQVNRGEISLEFYLYKRMPDNMHLLPVISLKPSKNILYKSSQIKRRMTQLIYDELYDGKKDFIQTH